MFKIRQIVVTFSYMVLVIGSYALLGISAASAQNTKLLGNACSVHIVSDVVYSKNRKSGSQPIPTSALYRTGIFKLFHEVESNPDIVIKFHKDVFDIDNQTVSITVFDADDNSVIYSEERKLVDEENDVDRLVSHFLARVRIERTAIAEADAAERKSRAESIVDERDKDALNNASQTVAVYSVSRELMDKLLKANRSTPEKCRIYISEAQERESADVVLIDELDNGQHLLVLRASDTNEVLHKVPKTTQKGKQGVYSMEQWINAQDWH
jgi:hypothetical protein